ncbi:MAG: hypothetical protein OXH15_09365 [Gammaproteobacteria bacterium]|nr:hypothetical protein [Gammaproteobacteria bacterium]
MKRLGCILAIALAALADAAEQADAPHAPRFVPVDIVLDSPEPVAAWQFELTDRNGAIKIVGIENGESPAFDRAPYYDRDATQGGAVERVVVADYTLADEAELPQGRTRIATVHVLVADEANFVVTLVAAATADGRPIDASISLVLATDAKRRNRWTEEPAA